MGRWLVLLFLIGAALIGLGLTDYIPEDMNLYALGGGGVLILLVLIFWWLGRGKRKMAMSVGGRRPGLGDAREMPALTTGRIRRIEDRRARERDRVRNAEVMEMRAVKPRKFRTGTA